MIPIVLLIVQFTLLGLYLWGAVWSAQRRATPPPWPLRLIVDATGSPSLRFSAVLFGVSLVVLVVTFATPSRSQQRRQQQFDRIEQLLREIRDGVQR